ncbi:polysaccharide deacetylase family protein [uncultured Mitsuokella sp.]|uniref:polysaccharide deacetylase family protein n=1 Tax=uncultured Mitsuokella sp. TaxID=453120 RepID=UPI0025D640E5|nr:polysaccharide deacetylase family protein [uncultured Mitsuokella sp.]
MSDAIDKKNNTASEGEPKATPQGQENVQEDLAGEIAALGDEDFTRRKVHHKRIRTFIQFIIIALCLALLAELFLQLKTYHPYDETAVTDSTEDTGFIAISYFGADRIGDISTLIGKDLLEQHLRALKDQGYVTITQKDIEDYYLHGKKLPKRALYLMFEDGRRDTAIFADDIIERLNFKATMMTYAGEFDRGDPKFLKPKELKDMEDSSFWEMGTNGYRLEYINVHDRYGNYLGEINPLRYHGPSVSRPLLQSLPHGLPPR